MAEHLELDGALGSARIEEVFDVHYLRVAGVGWINEDHELAFVELEVEADVVAAGVEPARPQGYEQVAAAAAWQ